MQNLNSQSRMEPMPAAVAVWSLNHWITKKDPAAAAASKSHQSCPTLCDPIDGSPTGSPVPGILQARTLEWVAISFSKKSLNSLISGIFIFEDLHDIYKTTLDNSSDFRPTENISRKTNSPLKKSGGKNAGSHIQPQVNHQLTPEAVIPYRDKKLV